MSLSLGFYNFTMIYVGMALCLFSLRLLNFLNLSFGVSLQFLKILAVFSLSIVSFLFYNLLRLLLDKHETLSILRSS